MARNKYPGRCYCCGAWVEPGYGHFERVRNAAPGQPKWRIKCVRCASGGILTDKDPVKISGSDMVKEVNMGKQTKPRICEVLEEMKNG